MSKENIILFYRHLEENPELKKKALNLQNEHAEQEEIIDAFLALAEKSGFTFTFREFMEHQYSLANEKEHMD